MGAPGDDKTTLSSDDRRELASPCPAARLLCTTADVARQENNAIAEGEAEYSAAYVLIDLNPANLAWPVPFEGRVDWDQRMVENMEMMNSDSPGKQARS